MARDAEERPERSGESEEARRTREADEFRRRMRRDTILTWTSRSLMLLGLIIVSQHLFAHAGYRPVPFGMGTQDLTIGYPTGGLVLIAGLVIWGRSPSR